MAATHNSVSGKPGSKPSEQIDAVAKRLAMMPLLALPEEDRPDPEPFIEYFRKVFLGGITEEDGRRSLPLFSLKLANWVFDNLTPWNGDVIIATYPKTGTTWVYSIATEILYKDEPKTKELLKTLNMHKYLECGIKEKYDVFEKYPWKRRLLGTHLSEELVNVEKTISAGGKIIYTMRNPKDQMVSFYHMIKNLPLNPEVIKELTGDGWNDFFDNAIAGKIPQLQKENEWYLDNLLGWWKHKNNANVLFVCYEDLKISAENQVRKIANFLNVDLSDEEVADIIKATSFQSMKQNASQEHKMIGFFRKGEIGNWKEYFTVAQSEKVDKLVEEKLSGTGINFIYE